MKKKKEEKGGIHSMIIANKYLAVIKEFQGIIEISSHYSVFKAKKFFYRNYNFSEGFILDFKDLKEIIRISNARILLIRRR